MPSSLREIFICGPPIQHSYAFLAYTKLANTKPNTPA